VATVLVLGVVATAAAAQPVSAPELMRRLASVPTAQARFVETRTSALLNAPLVLQGRLVYRRPAYLERHVQSPYDERTVIEGDTITIEDRNGGRRQMSVPQGPIRALLESTRATLAGDLAALERHFAVTAGGTLDAWQLRLAPREPALAALVSSIVFEGGGTRIGRIDVTEPGGDRTSTVMGEVR
jgi:outer membrane lipoprotein-sorting protein